MIMKPSGKLTARFIGIAAVVVVLSLAGVIDFHYLRMIDNDPYTNPVTVVDIAEDHIKLADGRAMWLAGGVDDRFREKLGQLSNRVDLEVDPETSVVHILGKKKHFICGTSMAPIIVPLIPRPIQANGREYLAVGRFSPYVSDWSPANPCNATQDPSTPTSGP